MSPSRPLDTRPSVMSLQVNVDKGPEGPRTASALTSKGLGKCASLGPAGGWGAFYPDSTHSAGLPHPFSR